MAEPIAPISDDDINGWVFLGLGNIPHPAPAVRFLARIRAEQRRADLEFNAGVEACAAVDDAHAAELRSKHKALATHFLVPTDYPELLARADEHDKRARALRAMKRPTPTPSKEKSYER
jgi:hypothetical protein